jgi:hypothetical protein
MLHDHTYFFKCNPVNDGFELIEPTTTPNVPDHVQPLRIGETVCYKATDVLHALPAGLWDSNVVSTYEFTPTKKGVFVRIRSPLNVVMETLWEIVGDEEDQLEMVELCQYTCPRPLAPVVKSQTEGSWQEIHQRMIVKIER